MNDMMIPKKHPFPTSHQTVQFRKIMETHGTLVLLPPGKILVDPNHLDQHFHYIMKGKLSISLQSEDGRELALSWLGADSIVGGAALLGNNNENVTIRVETQCMAYRLDKKTFFHLMETSPIFSLTMAKHLAEIYFCAMHQLESLAFQPAKERLYSLLQEQSMDTKYEEWQPLSRKFTQQELSNLIGANRVTVSRMISQLCAEGRIRLMNRQIEVRAAVHETRRYI
jgi:CRP/FNR family transcriptional regulator, cyclic AMP receptor protein